MLLRLLLVIVVGVSLLAAIRDCRGESSAAGLADAPPALAPAAGEEIEYRDVRPSSIFGVPPADMPATLRSWYRLRPDRRFLLAVAALHSLTTSEAEPALVVDFGDGAWRLSRAGQPVGTLPELASFEDGWTMLAGAAAAAPFKARGSARNLEQIQAALDVYSVRSLADALGMAGKKWSDGDRSEGVLRSAVHALLGLALQGHDPLEQNDALMARALAATVLLDRLGANTAAERALLADLLGYSGDARRIAAGLPDGDPLRAFVLRDNTTLRALAERPGASRYVRHLYLLRLAERGDVDDWADWLGKYHRNMPLDLGMFRSAFLLHDFSANRAMPQLAPYIVLLESWRAANPKSLPAILLRSAVDEASPQFAIAFGEALTGGAPARLLSHFEETLNDVGRGQSGPFLDSLAYRDYFRGYMYGSFLTYSRFVVDQLASVDATEKLAVALDSAPPGPGVEVGRWNRALLASMQGQGNVDELLTTVAERRVGSAALDRAFDELTTRAGSKDPSALDGARQLALRLDGRPANVLRFASAAYTVLSDMRLAGELYAHLERIAPEAYPHAVVWLNRMRGDAAALRRMAADTTLELDDRAYALDKLADTPGVTEADVRAAFQRFIDQDPLEWDLRSRYIDYLVDHDDYAEAGRLADDWLARPGRADGFDEIFARTALARSLERRALPDSAWTVIAPAVSSWQGGAMGQAAIARARLGNAAEALRIARAAVDRYPDSPDAYARLAEVHWILGEPAAAATMLTAAARRMSPSDWSWKVSPSLYRAIGNRPPAEAARAADALVAAGADEYVVSRLSLEFARRKQFVHAFEISSRARGSSLQRDIDRSLTSYRYLHRIRGAAAALAWLEQRVPADERNLASLIFYDHGDWDLLWDMVPHPERGPYPSTVWLYRATAAVRQGLDNHPRRAALLAYYARGSDDPYDIMGRHLVGLASEAELLALATEPDRLCEVAYYLGVRAAADGRYAVASDWLRIVQETRLTNEGEHRWAISLLDDWKTVGGLARFAER